MSINSVGYSPVCYSQAQKAPAKQNVSFASAEKSNPEKGKSFGKGFASYCITGLGQMIDGRTKTGFKQLGTEVALGGVSGLATALSLKAMQTGNKYGFIAGIGLGVLAGIGVIANKIHSVVDAYKGGK